MNLYRISQTENMGYDTYDSAVVAAETEEGARMIHPSEYTKDWNGRDEGYSSWCAAKYVSVQLIGVANEDVESGTVVSSFNAG